MASSAPDPKLPLAPVETWVFDLDNTLYPASSSLFPLIDKRMKAFIAQALDLPLDEAFTIQKAYFRKYGTTLRGLMIEHGMAPDDFLAYVHDIDHDTLDPNPALNQALDRLEGRKLIFTNGSERHAEKTLERIGISHHFEAIFDIKAADYDPKPNAAPYHKFLGDHGIEASRAVMLEDSHKNLLVPHALGMTTVLVHDPEHSLWIEKVDPKDKDLTHCHHVTDDLVGWLNAWDG